ncbi:MAG: hypothetical protein KatS3mg090_0546 [Patescibacteria group bacterium]|nr:MAG: hypothetical protein KatS3mg090_0546 [Patescibacteria group bacterium]
MLFFVVLFESVVLFMINLKMGRIFFVGTNNNINISSNCLKYNEEKIATLIKDPKKL